jgi:uracil-DNA glycosylase
MKHNKDMYCFDKNQPDHPMLKINENLFDLVPMYKDAIDCRIEECIFHRRRETKGKNPRYTVLGEGPQGADLMFVGERPKEKEEQTGRPFIGPAGGKLEEVLDEVGINIENVYLTYIMKCRTTKDDNSDVSGIDCVPGYAYHRICARYLIEEIAKIKPGAIVALGERSLKTLVGRKNRITIQQYRKEEEKSFIRFGLVNTRVFGTYNPELLVDRYHSNRQVQKEYRDAMIKDIKEALKYVDELGPRDTKPLFTLQDFLFDEKHS